MRLSIAGLRWDLAWRGAADADRVATRFGAYVTPDDGAAPDASLDVTVDPAWHPSAPVQNRFPGMDFERDADGAFVFRRADAEVVVDLGAHRARAVVRPTHAPEDPLEDLTALDTPLRLQVASELPGRGGAMVHACGYADDRGAVLFVARSGGGKTTTARKLPAAHVLSDDLVAVRRVDGVWRAWSLPFVGEWRRPTVPRSAPLRAVVFLRKAAEVSVTPCPRAAAFADALQAMVWFARGDAHAAALVDTSHALVSAVPCVTLALPREAPVLPLLDMWLR